MKWEDAKAKYASVGMRLPTRLELTKALITKIIEYWKKEKIKNPYVRRI